MDSLTHKDNKSKLLFAAFYLVATGLIFFVVSSFWQQNPFNFRPANVEEYSLPVQSEAALEVEKLKAALAEKEQKIASLESAIQGRGTTPAITDNGSGQPATADKKDQLIASLQARLAQTEGALQQAQSTAAPNAGGEWKQKYGALKASFDRLSSNEKKLRDAYKTISDDNRRLSLRLESLRKN